MYFTDQLEQDFVLGNLEIFREFDIQNFVNTANVMLESLSPQLTLNMNFEYYIEMVSKAIQMLEPLDIEKSEYEDFMSSYKSCKIDACNKLVKVMIFQPIEIRPQFLTQLTTNIGLTIDRAINGQLGKDEVDHYLSSDVLYRVKKQMVKSNLSYDAEIKDLVKLEKNELTPLTVSYIEKHVIPFIHPRKDYIRRREGMINTANEVIRTLKNTTNDARAYIKAMNDIKRENRLDTITLKQMDYILYNALRTLLEACAYLAFITIRKIGILCNNIVRCKEIMNSVFECCNPTIESVFDRNLIPSDSKSVGDRLLHGDIDAFETLATDVYEYNKGMISDSPFNGGQKIMGEQLFASVDVKVDQSEYKKEPYDETIHMIDLISHGLDTIAKNSDDYLIVFDDIVDKSGFGLRLMDKFAGTLGGLDDISEYESSVNISYGCLPSTDMFYRMMKEVRDYPENMETIGSSINDCYTKLNILMERFKYNINKEYENTLAVRQLEDFLDTFTDEFKELVIAIGAKFMLRLKNISVILEKYHQMRSTNLEDSEWKMESTEELDQLMFESLVEDYEQMTDLIFESLSQSYYIAKEKKERGVNIIIEAEETETSSQPETNMDTGTGAPTGSATTEKIKTKVEKYVSDLQNKLTNYKSNHPDDSQFIVENKDAFLNKNYANVKTKNPVLKYEEYLKASDLNGAINKLVGRLTPANLTPQKLQTLDENNIPKILYGSLVDEATVNATGNLQEGLTKYFKFGKNSGEDAIILANNDVKNYVNDAINFCEPYLTQTVDKYIADINRVSQELGSVLDGLVTESNFDRICGNFFMEADEKNQNQNTQATNQEGTTNTTTQPQETENQNTKQEEAPVNSQAEQDKPENSTGQSQENQDQTQNVNTITNMASSVDLILKYVKYYCNAVFTGSMHRYGEYMKFLHTMTPAPETTEQPVQEEQPQEQQTEPVENSSQNQETATEETQQE